MIDVRKMHREESDLLSHIDRSEYIRAIYRQIANGVEERAAGHECTGWDAASLRKLQQRFEEELEAGGAAFGAFEGERLVGFAVLAHQFRGEHKDRLQLDLMYVTRSHRRQGIGRSLMDEVKREAVLRGARYLYISSTETDSAFNFYRDAGSEPTEEVDQELFTLEPEDIHMIISLEKE
ncbi:GNAT family N-acetyltransferase [Paenibacillus physcomitrellae]|uniref:GNAT family N-acetyltransferase n=1 Tax=Paenibacillus physcomitrellae TaxID=1619311 RepID=A0ABQ1GKQ3_9BACL|nr:GNAT family N-acetyltransferase [Paenibacillus physcomitrellae]GGA45782.1 GNAT family N-acetyltransferase [Paenibacillus physcomitrellae]